MRIRVSFLKMSGRSEGSFEANSKLRLLQFTLPKPKTGVAPAMLVAALLVLCSFSVTPDAFGWSNLSDPRQFAWFTKPPLDVSLDTLAKTFDNYVLTKGDESKRDYLKSRGITTPFLQYIVLTEVHNPGSCTAQPKRNSVADRPGDFCWLSQYHPDWFLKDKYGNRLYNGSYYYMDPANAEFRSWWLSRAKVSQEQLGWDGVFLDNTDASLSRFQQLGKLPAKYTTDSAYSTAVKGFLNYLYTNYFKPTGRPLYANICAVRSQTVYADFLNYLDGALTEAWAMGWRTSYRTTADWEADLKSAESAQSRGKRVWLNSQGDKSNTTRQQFAYGSYLLIANGKASFRYSNSIYYSYAWIYSNYSYDLGNPLGPRYVKSGVWYRDFQRGQVVVNPSTHTATIRLTYTAG